MPPDRQRVISSRKAQDRGEGLSDGTREVSSTGMTRPGVDPRVDIGHVHLRVADVDRARAFYSDVIGFDVVLDIRGMFNKNWSSSGDAIFFSAGGYHHHVGVNTWTSAGGGPQAEPGSGLHQVGFLLPSRPALGALVARLRRAGVTVTDSSKAAGSEVIWVEDPDGTTIAFAAATSGSTAVSWTPEPGAPLDLAELVAAGERAERQNTQGFVPATHLAPEPIDAGTLCGQVHLRSADVERACLFYADALGFGVLEFNRESSDPQTGDRGSHLRLTADGERELLAFNDWHSAGHPRAVDGRTGLHHVAIRYPTRAALGDAVRRLRGIGHPEPADATDSATHIAAYYDDPDGNTIELYHDYPREQWRDPYSSPKLTKVELDELVALANRELPVAS
jgi:catechol 2,3-dioxygenase